MTTAGMFPSLRPEKQMCERPTRARSAACFSKMDRTCHKSQPGPPSTKALKLSAGRMVNYSNSSRAYTFGLNKRKKAS